MLCGEDLESSLSRTQIGLVYSPYITYQLSAVCKSICHGICHVWDTVTKGDSSINCVGLFLAATYTGCLTIALNFPALTLATQMSVGQASPFLSSWPDVDDLHPSFTQP